MKSDEKVQLNWPQKNFSLVQILKTKSSLLFHWHKMPERYEKLNYSPPPPSREYQVLQGNLSTTFCNPQPKKENNTLHIRVLLIFTLKKTPFESVHNIPLPLSV